MTDIANTSLAPKSLDQQLEAARADVLPQIQKIKELLGGDELLLIETDIIGAELLAFKIATSDEWKRYRIEVQNPEPAVKVKAANELVTCTCVFPPKDIFARVVAGHPGIIETCLPEVQEHAGAGRAGKVRKL